MRPRAVGLVAVLALVAVVMAGCTSSSTVRPTPSVLLPGVGAGYRLVAPTGPLSKEALAGATALPKSAMAAYLRMSSWRNAGESVWTSAHDGFVTDVVVTFDRDGDAIGLVDTAGRVLPGPATRTFTVAGAQGARGFLQTSAVDGQTMFCVIAFAAVDVRTFVVSRCTPYPQDTVAVSHLLVQQLARAGG